MWIVRLALTRPYTIAVASFFLLLMGSLAALAMRADIFPAVNIPVVAVVWNYPGLSAEDMEKRIVLVSERAYSTSVNGISRIESKSIHGVGLIKIYFEPEANIGGAVAQIASVSLTASRNMPTGTQPPIVLQYNASNVPVAQITARSDTLTEQQVYDYGLNFLRIRLFTIPGLATPAPYGGKTRQVMVDLDPAAVQASGLAPEDVVQTLLQSNLTVPAGTARIGELEYDINVNNSPSTIEEFNRIPLKTTGNATIFLGDVARVHDGFAVQENIVRVNGQRATYLAILKKSTASTLAVVEAAKGLLPAIRATAPKGIELALDFDQSVFVRSAILSVLKEAIAASALVALMILLFLGSWRSVVVVTISIPLAIFAALLGLYLTGETLNVMTLSGLALAIGMLVDDATVEVENIHRNQHAGRSLTGAILDGARQVALPAIAATTTVCIVFFPVVLLSGPAKFLFTPLALSVVFAMSASYLLSRTLVPTLSRMMLAKEPGRGRGFWGRVDGWRERGLEWIVSLYARVLRVAMGHRVFTVGCALVFCVVTAALSPFVGIDFFPEVDAGQMRLHVRAPIGTRIERTEEVVAAIEKRVREIVPAAELQTVNDSIGLPTPINLAYVQTDSIGGQDADILVALRPGHHPTAEYRRRIRQALVDDFPGVTAYFQSADIVSQVLNFGLPAPIDVQVESPDFTKSIEIAKALRGRIRAIPGTADVRIAQVLDYPALAVDVDRERAALAGITQRDVANNLLTSLSSSALVAPSFWINPQNNVNYQVVVQTPLARLRTANDLMATPLTTRTTPSMLGPAAPSPYLGSVAELHPAQDLAVVNHESVQRVLDVMCNVEGRDLGSVARAIDRAIADLKELPPGTRIKVRGQIDSMRSSFKSLGLGMLLASVLVYFVLVVLFQSWRDPLLIMVAVPGAIAGVLWMLALTGTSLNVESLMGTIMVIGIAVSNSILLVTFANEARHTKGLSAIEAAIEAGRTRLRPVLMTALAMILGMVPMALGMGEGAEQNAPLGRAVIGGLVVATAVTLFVVPPIYSWVRRAAPRRGAIEAEVAREEQIGVGAVAGWEGA